MYNSIIASCAKVKIHSEKASSLDSDSDSCRESSDDLSHGFSHVKPAVSQHYPGRNIQNDVENPWFFMVYLGKWSTTRGFSTSMSVCRRVYQWNGSGEKLEKETSMVNLPSNGNRTWRTPKPAPDFTFHRNPQRWFYCWTPCFRG